MTTIIEIQENGLKVMMNNQVTLIGKYEDSNGVYFLNENLVKQYVKNTPTESEEVAENKIGTSTIESNEVKDYKFEVEYEHNGRLNGFALTETSVKAKSFDEALEKPFSLTAFVRRGIAVCAALDYSFKVATDLANCQPFLALARFFCSSCTSLARMSGRLSSMFSP